MAPIRPSSDFTFRSNQSISTRRIAKARKPRTLSTVSNASTSSGSVDTPEDILNFAGITPSPPDTPTAAAPASHPTAGPSQPRFNFPNAPPATAPATPHQPGAFGGPSPFSFNSPQMPAMPPATGQGRAPLSVPVAGDSGEIMAQIAQESASAQGDPNEAARLAKAHKDATDANKDLYEKLAERDRMITERELTIAELNNDLTRYKKHYKNASEECKGLTTNKAELEKRATEAEKKCEKLTNDLKSAKSYQNELIDTVAQNDKDFRKQKSRLEQTEKEKNILKSQNEKSTEAFVDRMKDLQEQNKELHEQVTTATNELKTAQSELQDIFTEGPTVSLQDLLARARNNRQSHNLTRQASQTSFTSNNSLFNDKGEQKKKQKSLGTRLVSGASLKEQLEDAGYTSSADGDEDETADDTLHAGQIGPEPAPEPLSFSSIVSVETTPMREPPPKPMSFSNLVSVETTPIHEPAAKPMGFSSINSVGTTPIREPEPEPLSFSSIISVETTPIRPPKTILPRRFLPTDRLVPPRLSLSARTDRVLPGEKPLALTPAQPAVVKAPPPRVVTQSKNIYHTVKQVPWWFMPLLYILISIYAIALILVISERRMWTSANDLARLRVVSMSLNGANTWNPFISFFSAADYMLGRPVGHFS